jgi:hypothetical protein
MSVVVVAGRTFHEVEDCGGGDSDVGGMRFLI